MDNCIDYCGGTNPYNKLRSIHSQNLNDLIAKSCDKRYCHCLSAQNPAQPSTQNFRLKALNVV